jgi:hypothetical protein
MLRNLRRVWQNAGIGGKRSTRGERSQAIAYGMFHNLEYTDMALSVSEEARKKLRVLIKKKKREMRLAFLGDPSP